MDQRPPDTREALAASRWLVFNRRIAGPIWRRVGMTAVLEVPGRSSGTPAHVTLVPWEVDGTLYLMSQYGVTDWVRNLRAAGRGALQRKGHTTPFTAVEVDGAERERVIAVFRGKTPKPFRRDFEQLPSAGDHPTFRVQPIT